MSPSADRNALLGILVLQMDFLRRDELIAAMHAWVLDVTGECKPLASIFGRHLSVDCLPVSPYQPDA
jgi:hypothetical protein